MFALLLLAVSVRAADVPGFDQANRLYEEGKYHEAANAYGRLLSSGGASSALLFNLGNAQFKAGEIGKAIVAYRKAERITPRDPDLRANLQFARKQVSGPTLQPDWQHRFTGELTTNQWTLLAVVPIWAWFGLMIARWLKPAWKPMLRTATLIAGVVSLLGCGTLGFVLNLRLKERTVVVTERNAVVRYGPFAESQSAFTAGNGAEFRLLDTKDDWFQVSPGGKTVGWIKTNATTVLP